MSERTISSVEELEALYTEKRAEREEERARADAELPADLLLWLALVPKWTEPLLEGVGRLRKSGWRRRVGEVVGELEARGWLRRAVSPAVRGRETPPDLLTLTLEVAERQLERRLEDDGDRDRLWLEIHDLGEAISEVAGEGGPAVPAETGRWARLAADAEKGGGGITRALTGGPRIESWRPAADLLESRVAAEPAGEALRWIEAAQPLASVLARGLDTTLDVACRRAALHLELRDRRRHDLKHLESFLERDDQIAALRRLFEGRKDPEAPWALHLLGSGGVGKTMLVRHLTARLADAERWNLTVARVDFDFLNPDYPRLAPGLLLWAFAQELRVFDRGGSAGHAFDDAERIFRQLHDALRAGRGREGRATDHELFRKGIEIYAQALELLPEPVVLVIDTCEELTKPRAGVDSRFNVDETFHILEALHHRVPSMRVVFAGRRPLATSGAGWRCSSCGLPPRGYLSLFEVRGFTVDEARRYLGAAGVPGELVEPVVRRSSPDAGGVATIEWLEGEGPAEVLRCNPYELRFFAEWAMDDPPPSPEDVERAGGDRYVELRILRRLHSPRVAELLPILGLARHLDEDLLRAVSGLDGGAFADFLVELQGQEWIDRRTAPAGEGFRRILSVEEGLRLRLLSYYSNRSSDLEAQRRAAAEVLRRRTLDGDPAELDVTDLDAALRVVGGLPGADRWWRRVEERLFAERDAAWVGQQAAYLVGPEGAAGLPDEASWPELRTVHPLRPAVLATLALAESRQPGGGLTLWTEVAEGAAALPEIGADLDLRANAMVVVAGRGAGFGVDPEVARGLWRQADELDGVPSSETVAALVAAAEAVVEESEEVTGELRAMGVLRRPPADGKGAGERLPGWLHRRLESWAAAGGEPWTRPELAARLNAMALALDGRCTARVGEEAGRAPEVFERALEAAERSAPGRWLAWREPEWFGTRLRLEAIRALCPAVLGPGECFARFGAVHAAEGVELDRLLAAIAGLGLAEGVESRAFQVATQAEAEDPVAPLRCRAHYDVPPLRVQLASVDAAAGDVVDAFETLGEIRRRADAYPTAVVRHAARAELDLAVRLRHLDGKPGAALTAAAEDPDAEEPDGEDRRLLELAGALRDGWDQRPSVESARKYLEGVAVRLGREGREREPLAAWRRHLIRLVFDRLDVGSSAPPPEPSRRELAAHRLVERLGPRRAGLAAWREADLLALRHPASAAPLFAVARLLLADAADPVGEAVCFTAELCCLAGSDPEAVQRGLQKLRELWHRAVPDLPRGEPEVMDEVLQKVPRPLRPWWLRSVLLAWQVAADPEVRASVPRIADKHLEGPREPMLAWVEPRYHRPASLSVGGGGDDTVGSPELGGTKLGKVVSIPPASPQKSTPVPPRSKVSEKLIDAVAGTVGVVLGLAIVGGFFYGVYSALRGAGSLVGLELHPAVWGVVTFFAVGAGVWVAGLAAALRAFWRRGRWLALWVRSVDPGEIDLVPTEVSRKWRIDGWPPWHQHRRGLPLFRFELGSDPDREPYAEQIPKLGDRFADAAVELGSWRTIELALDRRHELAWEGILGALAPPGDLDFRRTVPEAPGWPAAPTPSREAAAVYVAYRSAHGRDVAARGWQPLDGYGVDFHLFESAEVAKQLAGRHRGETRLERVVHLIGAVIESSAGLRFRISDPRGMERGMEKSARERPGEEADLRAQDLPELFPELSLVVLQEVPVPEIHPRSAADRRQAGWLRAFAGEVHAAGVPTVLTVPHLLPRTAAPCLRPLARLVRRRRRLIDLVLEERAVAVDTALLDVVEKIRRVIRRDPTVGDEAAWDVVLYAPPGWRNPFRKTRDRPR